MKAEENRTLYVTFSATDFGSGQRYAHVRASVAKIDLRDLPYVNVSPYSEHEFTAARFGLSAQCSPMDPGKPPRWYALAIGIQPDYTATNVVDLSAAERSIRGVRTYVRRVRSMLESLEQEGVTNAFSDPVVVIIASARALGCATVTVVDRRSNTSTVSVDTAQFLLRRAQSDAEQATV